MTEAKSDWKYEKCVGGRRPTLIDSQIKWVMMSKEEQIHARELWDRAFDFMSDMSRRERIKLQGGRVRWWNRNKKRPTISQQIGRIVLSQGWV